jgi:hypothetical protein
VTDVVRLVPLTERLEAAKRELVTERMSLILDSLDTLRDRVKRGEITSVAVAFVTSEHDGSNLFVAGKGQVGGLYAASAALLDRQMRNMRAG